MAGHPSAWLVLLIALSASACGSPRAGNSDIDASRSTDAADDAPAADRVVVDAPSADVLDAMTPGDVGADAQTADAAPDVGSGDSGTPPGDVPMLNDASVLDAGTPTGRVLRAQRFVTVAPSETRVGARRLEFTGFQSVSTRCVGSRCLTGGFAP